MNNKVFLCSCWISCVLICTHCLLSCQWALLRTAWFPHLHSFPSDICIHWWGPLGAFCSPGWTAPAVPASLDKKGAPVPLSPSWPLAGLPPEGLCPTCTGESRTGHVGSSSSSRICTFVFTFICFFGPQPFSKASKKCAEYSSDILWTVHFSFRNRLEATRFIMPTNTHSLGMI